MLFRTGGATAQVEGKGIPYRLASTSEEYLGKSAQFRANLLQSRARAEYRLDEFGRRIRPLAAILPDAARQAVHSIGSC